LSHSDIEKAGKFAEQIAVDLNNSNGNLGIIYYKIEQVLINYRKTGEDLELIMPGIYEVDLKYNRTYPDGRSIWFIYADALHDELCKPDGLLHKKIETDANLSGSSVVEIIMNILRLPQSSAMLISPIAASIIGLGTKAFCKHGNESDCN
jgi:hypothetical protein